MESYIIPTFRIAFLFHQNLELLSRTLPQCVEALTASTRESYEIVLVADGSPPGVVHELIPLLPGWGVDELRVRDRRRGVASGDPSNNGHARMFDHPSPYLIVIEDDVLVFRTDPHFDVLAACRQLLARHPEIPVICRADDYDEWSWQLEDLGGEVEPGVRSVNRVSTHLIVYEMQRFVPVAGRFGGFELDVFVDREDLSYNWEDVVSHVGTTGGRRIAFPAAWPMSVFHCDRKVAPGSMHNTQDPRVKLHVFEQLIRRFQDGPPRPDGRAPAAAAGARRS